MEIIGKVSDLIAPKPPADNTKKSKDLTSRDEFLQLLISQLKFQDPMQPMDSQQFAAQLAQFSTVERLMNIENALATNNQQSSQLSQVMSDTLAASLIGKTVNSVGNTVNHTAGSGDLLQFELSAASKTDTIAIKDSGGNVVKQLNVGGQAAGRQSIAWDGKDDRGNDVPAGLYTFEVAAKDSNGKDIAVQQFQIGMIEGVRYDPNGLPKVIINGKEVALSDVVEIGQSLA